MKKTNPDRGVNECGQGPKSSRSLSSGGSTRYKQALKPPSPDRPVARVFAAINLHPPLSAMAVLARRTKMTQ